ncbi:Rho GTPase activation protein, partial [Catenaria anguillulae PL171]
KRISELRLLVNMLPLANYTVLRALIAHLVSVVSNADRNKMTVRNIGIVFAPTLGIPAGVFSLMLLEFGAVFDVDTGRGRPQP